MTKKTLLSSIRRWTLTLLRSLQDFLYPPLCLHCKEPLPWDFELLCKDCFESIEWIDPKNRCRCCLAEVFGAVKGHCKKCQKKPSPFYLLASPFEPLGPPQSIQSQMQHLSGSFLTDGASSLMALHYLKMNMPLPDIITSLPRARYKTLMQGSPPSEAIAKNLAKIFQRPYANILRAKGILASTEFILVKPERIVDKRVLLVSDKLTSDFFLGGEALAEGCPHSIMGATFTFIA